MPDPDSSNTISVIIPCHNAERFLSRCLDSVASQTRAATEIIIVVDSCTDQSMAIASSHSTRPIVIEANCRNGATSRNIGITAARGDWIAFLDADDYWLPHHLEQSIELLAEGDAVGCLSSRFRISIEETEPNRDRPPDRYKIEESKSNLADTDFIQSFADGSLYFAMSSCVLNRQRLLEVEMLNPQQLRRHDIEMWLRVIHGHQWAYHPTPSSVYQVDTPGSISSAIADRELYFYRALVRNAERYPTASYRDLLSRSARRAVVSNLTDGSVQSVTEVVDEVQIHLGARDRWMIYAARRCPGLFSRLNLLRRRMRGLRS